MTYSVHLRSDYRFTYDYVDTADRECPQTIMTSSLVVTAMPTVQPARFRVTRITASGGYRFVKAPARAAARDRRSSSDSTPT